MTAETAVDDADLWSDETLQDPYPVYAQLRQRGAAVYLPRYELWALPRYESVRTALSHPEVFSSEQGVGFTNEVNAMMPGIILHDDGQAHARMRAVLSGLLGPRKTRALASDIEQEADALVDRVLEKPEFDGVKTLAEVLPVSVVARLVGLPEERRMNLLPWVDATFNVMGPMNERTVSNLPLIQQFWGYLEQEGSPAKLAPGSWGAAIYEAGERGEIPHEACFNLMFALAGAGMDTTISAIGSALWLLASHPGEWEKVRAHPELIPSAFNEIVRLESPVQMFARVMLQDFDADGTVVPEGSRIALLYASANRDEAKWGDGAVFDVTRNPTDHVAFGYGLHACVGQPLARIEVQALIAALAKRVKSLEVGQPVWGLNNTTRRLASLPLRVEYA